MKLEVFEIFIVRFSTYFFKLQYLVQLFRKLKPSKNYKQM